MKKRTKVVLILALTIIALIIVCSKAFAESTTYSSYMNMLIGNTTLTGDTRTYKQRNHQISFTITQLDQNTHMYTALVKDGFFSDTTVCDRTVDFTKVNETYTYGMGNHDKGKYYYYFSTYGQYYYGAFYAKPVNMTCYD